MPFPGSCSLYGVKFKTYWYVHCLSIFHQRRLGSPDLSAKKDSTRTINTEDTQILYQYGWFNACHWLWFHPGTASLLYTVITISDYQTGWWENRFCSSTAVWVSGIGSLTRKAMWPHRTPLHHLHQCCYHQAGIIESPWLRQRSTEDRLSLSCKYFK